MANLFTKALRSLRPDTGELDVEYGGVKPTEVIGAPGTHISGGYIQRDEKNPKLWGSKRYVTFSDTLINVAIVGAGVRYFLNIISRADWKAEPVDTSIAAVEAAAFVDEVLADTETPWHRIVRRSAMYKFYGFSLQEWTAKVREDGQIGFLDIAPRPQSTIEKWDRDRQGNILGVIQRSPQTYEEIPLPRGKLVYVVDDTLNDSPEGLGIIRHLVPVTERLLRYEQLEGFGFETDLRGIPVGRAPRTLLQQMVTSNKISQKQMDAALKTMEDFIQAHIKAPDSGLLLDSLTYTTTDDKHAPSSVPQWDIELLKGGSTTMPELNKAIERLTRDAARLLGVEGLLLGDSSKGSHALATDKSHNFYLTVESTLGEIAESYQKDLVDTIWALNGFDEELKPELVTSSVKTQNIEQITAALRDLAQAGAPMAIDDPAVNQIRDLLGIARLDDDLEGMLDASLINDTEEDADIEEMPEETPTDEEVPDGAGSGDE